MRRNKFLGVVIVQSHANLEIIYWMMISLMYVLILVMCI